MKNYVITIGRQFGSNGHEIGKRLAKRLEIPFYDRDIITKAASESNYDEETFKKLDENRSTSFLFSVAMNIFPYTSKMENIDQLSISDKLFTIQKKVIIEMAEKSPCVIVGRCSNFILKEKFNCINIFVYGDRHERIEKIAKNENIPFLKSEEIVSKVDKRRAAYYNYYTGEKWGAVENYDVCISSSVIGLDGCVDALERYTKARLADEIN
ncbi:MAG: cytidylate kinase-like family protein [Clostridia bacterium]|jgi:cytidylate kinase|nr:cytidylate kinase-like family protein [Clostridia bacterium]MCI1998844.1 cytidylate kinase-like family protein [Clostridia bacterium]MCI2013594.1 cytidylate kinase-like family protein [Clostridia bacterium]